MLENIHISQPFTPGDCYVSGVAIFDYYLAFLGLARMRSYTITQTNQDNKDTPSQKRYKTR